MKNQIKSISLVAILFVALTTVCAAQANSVIADVQNSSVQNLGVVAIYASGSPYYVNVPGKGDFPTQVPTTPELVVVNNYAIPQGQNAVVKLQSGAQVKVSVSGNIIVVTDQTIMN